jgi:hypothetical protein
MAELHLQIVPADWTLLPLEPPARLPSAAPKQFPVQRS